MDNINDNKHFLIVSFCWNGHNRIVKIPIQTQPYTGECFQIRVKGEECVFSLKVVSIPISDCSNETVFKADGEIVK